MVRRRWILPFAIAAIAAVGLGLQVSGGDDFFALRKNFEIFGSLYQQLVADYVDELDAEHVMRTGIDAMLEDLDPYTVFYDEATSVDADIVQRARYGRVGLNVELRGGKVTVGTPDVGTSGYKQGIRTGDVVLQVGDLAVQDLTLKDVETLLRGEPGSAVEVIVEREGRDQPITFVLTREAFQVQNVSYSGFVDDDASSGVGYIKLDRFATGATDEVEEALRSLQDSGSLKGLILDLRDNPGGLLEDALGISQLFLPQGSLIVSVRGKLAESERAFETSEAPVAPDIPLVILVNGISASASEIVAGAVQDHDRGLILGSTTFGKGLVQIFRQLPYNTILKITTSRYYTPSGRSIQSIDYTQGLSRTSSNEEKMYRTAGGRVVRDGNGIEPDVPTQWPEPSELEEALDRRAAFFFFANHYAAGRASIAPDFSVTSDVAKEFRQWLEAEGFDYTTELELSIDGLEDHLQQEGYTEGYKSLQVVRTAVQRDKAAAFERHDRRIKERLRLEIVARFADPSEQARTALAVDPDVHEAARLLRDTRAYGKLLSIQD